MQVQVWVMSSIDFQRRKELIRSESLANNSDFTAFKRLEVGNQHTRESLVLCNPLGGLNYSKEKHV